MWVPPTSVGFRLPAPVALSHFVNLKALTLQARQPSLCRFPEGDRPLRGFSLCVLHSANCQLLSCAPRVACRAHPGWRQLFS